MVEATHNEASGFFETTVLTWPHFNIFQRHLQGIEAALQDPMMRVAQTQLRLEGLKTQRADPFLHSPASPVTTHDCHIITYIKEKKTGKNKGYLFLLKVLINLL